NKSNLTQKLKFIGQKVTILLFVPNALRAQGNTYTLVFILIVGESQIPIMGARFVIPNSGILS
ncbi:hypothetical protein, partial [Vibrio sp. 2089]|uniref:hypothetical protein n=1 Tax=Vibrio sp. 2089 TaxID=3074591 RepID=UPI00296527D1